MAVCLEVCCRGLARPPAGVTFIHKGTWAPTEQVTEQRARGAPCEGPRLPRAELSGETGLQRPPPQRMGGSHTMLSMGTREQAGGRQLGEERRCEQGLARWAGSALALTLSAGTLAYLWVQPTPFLYVPGEGVSIQAQGDRKGHTGGDNDEQGPRRVPQEALRGCLSGQRRCPCRPSTPLPAIL